MPCRRRTTALLLAAQVFFSISLTVSSQENPNDEEALALLKFKSSLNNATQLDNWDKSIPMCNGNSSNWKGLFCSNGELIMLQLEDLGLSGKIDVGSLAKLSNLRQFSVANNQFSGNMPDVKKLNGLRALYLTNNKFTGDIPDDAFTGLNGIRRVIIANNEFTGKIPRSLTNLPKLVDLQMQNNEFVGDIPDFPNQVDLKVNFANNKLDGEIPPHLRTQYPTSFQGNNLCGPPLEACKPSKKFPKLAIIIIITIIAAVAFLVIALAYFIILHRRKPSNYKKSTISNLQRSDKKKEAQYNNNNNNYNDNNIKKLYYKKNGGEAAGGILHFVRKERQKFELEDLLRASAEVLGSGGFGSTYKAELLIGGSICMAVKRFREMNNVGKEEFFQHMRRLGKLTHPNLVPIVAFYYGKEEKLLVSDFVQFGSLASHLHGKRSPNQPGLDWPTRLKIIKGVAKGLDYLYKEFPDLILPHGHLKSSNVLLDNKCEPVLSDYALLPVINKDHAQQFMVAYKSPEFTRDDRVTQKTDVWSLGILILELLTGHFPANYLKQGKGANADLASWVNSVVREEWTGEVFDKEMNGTKNREGQMLKLLKIGMCCCELNVEKRWDLREAIEKIEELKEKDSEEEFSSYGSEDIYSSRAMTDDDFSFSVVEKV